MRLFTTLLLLLPIFTKQLQAQATLSVQGTIQKSFGAAVDDGAYSITFKLYESATGGLPVWTETQDEVDVIGGVYSVLLGEVTPLTAAFNTTYYLGVAVNGGAELIPRARLTSSPYALSLIGQGNTFPSTGPVGAGTASPEAGVELHVKATDSNSDLLLESVEEQPRLTLKSASNTGVMDISNGSLNLTVNNNMPFKLFSGANERLDIQQNDINFRIPAGNFNFFRNNVNEFSLGAGIATLPGTLNVGTLNGYNNGDLSFNHNGSTKVKIVSNGLAVTNGFVDVQAGASVYHPTIIPWGGGGQSSGSILTGMRAQGIIICSVGYFVSSDSRIKKETEQSKGAEDLGNLMRLKVTDYRHIDEAMHGRGVKKGLIAQEVAEVFPQAIFTSSSAIPSIYSMPASASATEGQMTFRMDKNHGLAAGDQVEIILDSGKETFEVVRTEGDQSFTVGNWTNTADAKAFIYGKVVDDFKQVDYDQVFTLGLSAMQELARRLEQLEQDNAALRLQNSNLQEQNNGLRSDVNGMNERLLKLETLVTGSAQR